MTIQNWRVMDHVMNYSDHNTIASSINTTKIFIPAHRPWYKANWQLLQTILATKSFNIEEETTQKTLDRQVETLYKYINEALDKACPMTKPKYITSEHNNWYAKAHKKQRHRVSKQYTRFKNMVDSNKKELAKQDYKKHKKYITKLVTLQSEMRN